MRTLDILVKLAKYTNIIMNDAIRLCPKQKKNFLKSLRLSISSENFYMSSKFFEIKRFRNLIYSVLPIILINIYKIWSFIEVFYYY